MPFDPDNWVRAFLVTLVRVVTGVRPRWVGVPPKEGQRVYVANHQSHLDALAVWAALPEALRARTRPVAAGDYWDKGALRRYISLRILRAVLIDRTHVSRAHHPLDGLMEPLRHGDSLIIFPEGTRNSEEGLRPFKSGIYHLARRMPGLTFIPVFLQNMNRVMPKGRHVPLPLICNLSFGPPLTMREEEDKASFLSRTREAILSLAGGV